jgi:death on curing protein
MLHVNEAIRIHHLLIADFGGAQGVRDWGSLESALARPYQTFDGIELYATPQAKASAIMESLAINHPFVDGNKRIAYTLFRLLLLNAGVDIAADLDARYAMVIGVSKGEMRYEALLEWVEKYLVAAT